MGLPVMPLDLQQQRKQYRAPFKVRGTHNLIKNMI
ncbi:unnamed protein product [Nippostrongylus brasiliensis]|uniref:Transposase n=1 Tax=Nippostrongylus brasiliensis TaxID=27835 RepID=A0A0N4XRE3_NIPBR|nr:unnamed protein product [Nippostrongylus brasiliensis]